MQILQFFVVSMKSQRKSKEQMRHPYKVVSHSYKVVSKFATPPITRSIYMNFNVNGAKAWYPDLI
jgi:hypothetical protein